MLVSPGWADNISGFKQIISERQNWNYIYNQIIVGFKHNSSNKEIESFIEEYGCELMAPIDEFRVYALVLPRGVYYSEVKRSFLNDKRVRYVLPSYYMHAQSMSDLEGVVKRARDENESSLNEIGFLQAQEYMQLYSSLLPESGGVVFALLDSSGLHPELIQQLNDAGIYRNGVCFQRSVDNSVNVVNNIEEYTNGHGTQVATLLSTLGEGSEIMHIQFDGGLGTFIEGIKYAIRETRDNKERLIINSSMSISLESFSYDTMKFLLRDYYLAQSIEEARIDGQDDKAIYDSYIDYRNEARIKSYGIVDEIFTMVDSGIINNFQNWDESDWAIVREKFSLFDEEISLLKYAEHVARRDFQYFVKSPLYEDFEEFSQHAIIVSAAGNCNDSGMALPSSYPGVIGVGASYNDNIASYSRYGNAVDLYAPGGYAYGDVWTYDIQDGSLIETKSKRGTSLAAPFVTAMVGLIWNENPDLTPAEMSNIIIASSCNIFDSNLEIYFKQIDGQQAAILACAYSSIKDVIALIDDYTSDEFDLLEQINQNLIFSQKLISEQVENRLLNDIDLFISGVLTAKELEVNFLTQLWNLESDVGIRVASGLAINYLQDDRILKSVLEKSISGTSTDIVQKMLDIVSNEDNNFDIFKIEHVFKSYVVLSDLYQDLKDSTISQSSFMQSVELIFGMQNKMFEKYIPQFVSIINRFINAEIDSNQAQQMVCNIAWDVCTSLGDEDSKIAIALYVDSLDDVEFLKNLLQHQFPQLDSGIMDVIIQESLFECRDTDSLTLHVFDVANTLNYLNEMFTAIEKFDLEWNNEIDYSVDYLKLSDLGNWEDWSKFLDQNIQRKEYMENLEVYQDVEFFYTGLVENLCSIFLEQKIISSEFQDAINAHIWDFVNGDIDIIAAQGNILDSIEQEAELPQILLGTSIIRSIRWDEVDNISVPTIETNTSLTVPGVDTAVIDQQFGNIEFDFNQFL
ncbi:MAG: S8/S53 family peptidase [Candidatus Kaelpia imicola]|nr:S8/S53 family peptidase [Candidatus Kaelpia imicola]